MKVSFAIIISDGNENPKYTIGTSLGSTTLNADNKKIDSEFANSLANGCFISGYKWDNKWYTYNNDILDEFDFGQELNSSTTIYALYKPISLSIKYEDTSGIGSGKYELPTEVTNVIYNPNTPFGEMTPIYGYEFLGWSVKNDAAVEIPASSNKLEDLLPYLDSNNSVTLYPVFRLYTLTVSFDKGHEDAVGSMSNQTYNYESNLGNNLLPELPVMIFAYEGHKFAYWQATLDQSTYNIGGSDDQTEELILAITEALKNNDAEMVVKAIWEGATYNITYVNANLKAEYVDKYSSYIYDSTDETYEFSLPQANELEIFKGYTFVGWYTNSDLEGEPFVFDTNTKGDLILYAKWTANSYTISFDDNVDNEELGTMTNITATFNQQITLSPIGFTRPGYTFVGWSLTKDAITANYLDQATITDNFGKDNISNEATITLYAVWQENKYNIIYQVNGQTYIEEKELTYNYMQNYNLKEYSVAAGYEFSGWYLNGSDVPANWFEESIFEYVFTATYTEIEYKINFNVDKNALKDQNNIPESKVNIKYSSNEILKYYQESELNAGYEFIGWYLNDSPIGKYLVTGADLNITKDNKEVNLVAKFNTYFTINFDTNGGEGSLKPVRITINEENSYDLTNYLPQNITKLGYALSGFTTEVNGEKLENNILEENYSVGQDVTIYLYWEPITYNIE